MSEDIEITIDDDELSIKGQLAKMLVGTAAAFLATKAAEKAFMAVREYRKTH